MTYTLDVELFISEVKKYPEIWDLNNENNRFKIKKQAAWSEIAKVFIQDFDDMPDIEKMDVYRKLHCKWRNIRDSYVRHVKRRDGKKGYLYAKHLSFLNNIYKHLADSDGDSYWSDEDSKPKTTQKQTELNKPNKTRHLELSESWQSDEETPSTIENLKRKRVKKQETIEYVEAPLLPDPGCSYSIEDEDRSFFDSLLPAVRNFNMDQKLEFRSEVICLIKSIRNKVSKKIKLDPDDVDFDD